MNLSKSKKYPNFYFGPMSLNIVDAIIEISNDEGINLGFIPSRRQIECKELGGGYVNRWTTEDFSKYVRGRCEKITLERDHSGPHQGSLKDSGERSVIVDCNSGFDVIHIDPWKAYTTIATAAYFTHTLMETCLSSNPDILFEIGTEEAIRKYTPVELEIFLKMLQNYNVDFSKIIYCVVQSGTSIKGLRNTGSFNLINSKKMCEISRSFGLVPKEHNSDYLSTEEIKKRILAGVESFNIAPELGVLESDTILSITDNDKLSTTRDEFIDMCVKSKKWKKWIDKGSEIDREKLARISGHYIFSSDEFLQIRDRILETVDLDNVVKNKVKKRVMEIACLIKS
tara:strand:+ start:1010 stop:2032 length:1023 start_codon:yes stop_codon:yes gene_type:complete